MAGYELIFNLGCFDIIISEKLSKLTKHDLSNMFKRKINMNEGNQLQFNKEYFKIVIYK